MKKRAIYLSKRALFEIRRFPERAECTITCCNIVVSGSIYGLRFWYNVSEFRCNRRNCVRNSLSIRGGCEWRLKVRRGILSDRMSQIAWMLLPDLSHHWHLWIVLVWNCPFNRYWLADTVQSTSVTWPFYICCQVMRCWSCRNIERAR